MILKKRIAQIGSFDVENFGDLLFPDVLKHYLGKKFNIDLYSPNGGIKPFTDGEYVYPIKELEENIKKKKYKAIIIGGGDVIRTDSRIFIKNNTYELSSEPSLEFWAYPIMLAKKYNIPVLFNSVGVTNDFNKEEELLVKNILQDVDYLTVRDTEAQKTLEKSNIFESKVIPDSVISISKIVNENKLNKLYDNLVENKIIPKIDNFIILQHNTSNVDNKEYFEKIIELVELVSKEYKVLLMPIGYVHDDDKVLKKIYNKKIKNVYMVSDKTKLTPYEMISIIYRSEGYIGTSMHGAVVSTSFGKKILILNSMNSKKLHGFANVINKTNLDVNNHEYLKYLYETCFNNQEKVDVSKLIIQVEKSYKNMINIINKKVKRTEENHFEQFIRDYYKRVNNYKEYVGQFTTENINYLNRVIFRYDKNDAYKYSYIIKTSDKEITFEPCVNDNICVDKIMVNGKKIKLEDNNYFAGKSINIVNSTDKLKIEIYLKK